MKEDWHTVARCKDYQLSRHIPHASHSTKAQESTRRGCSVPGRDLRICLSDLGGSTYRRTTGKAAATPVPNVMSGSAAASAAPRCPVPALSPAVPDSDEVEAALAARLFGRLPAVPPRRLDTDTVQRKLHLTPSGISRHLFAFIRESSLFRKLRRRALDRRGAPVSLICLASAQVSLYPSVSQSRLPALTTARKPARHPVSLPFCLPLPVHVPPLPAFISPVPAPVPRASPLTCRSPAPTALPDSSPPPARVT
ncbi:hypothetical protein SCP_0506660 [Sparassis crispa]|uniref:Uncharacterized protein n=1 Tax=Sparassis crispa TaxID=139825 RepID=A0A401GMZ8_9APHY|nr:hypothetical protein SCP_0506660 [Sparassis crispa]GBE83611.1 hypothetical protein SCP_0506660 [Sparassis crispa]